MTPRQDRSAPVTDGLSDVTQPVFERNGKYLYVIASTDAGPALDWFAQSTRGSGSTRAIYAIALTKDAPNPFARESDEEKSRRPGPTARSPHAGSRRTPAEVALEGIANRIVGFPITRAEIEQIAIGEANQLYYLRMTDGRAWSAATTSPSGRTTW